MAIPRMAPLPPSFVLASGMQVVVTAIDSVTGAVVPNVSISNVSISVDTSGTASSIDDSPMPLLVPSE